MVYNGITLLFGQIRHQFERRDTTVFNREAAITVLITLRCVINTILRENQKLATPKSYLELIIILTRILWHKFCKFLTETVLGETISRQITLFRRHGALHFLPSFSQLCFAIFTAYSCYSIYKTFFKK